MTEDSVVQCIGDIRAERAAPLPRGDSGVPLRKEGGVIIDKALVRRFAAAHDDNLAGYPYDAHMAKGAAYIVVRIQTKDPIEVGDFVSTFSSLASQYDKFIREEYPDVGPEAQIFVKQIKRGSIIFELLPFVPYILLGAPIINQMDQILIVDNFIKRYGGMLKA